MDTLTLITVAILAFVIGWSWDRALIRALRRHVGQMQEKNLELRAQLIARERLDDQVDQIAQIPERRQVEILEKIWARKVA